VEVSSPGVERPLVRARDFERFRGQSVVVAGREALRGGDHRLEGELLGLDSDGSGSELVRIRLDDGEEVGVPRENVRKIHLAFTWK
jgi:ribosome maturation factor RimP